MPKYLTDTITGQEHNLTKLFEKSSKDILTVGRHLDCDIQLKGLGHINYRRISRTHAKIIKDGETIKIVDDNSTNGTSAIILGRDKQRRPIQEHGLARDSIDIWFGEYGPVRYEER